MDLAGLMKSMSLNEPEASSSDYNVFAAVINDNHTDIVFAKFANKYMVIVTQHDKLGSLMKVNIDQPTDILEITEAVYSVQLVFGSDEPHIQAAARYIAEHIGVDKQLMIFLCLKDYSAETVRKIAEVILNSTQHM